MSRQERKNMIDFIQKMKGIDEDKLVYMTDDDIEYVYITLYFHQEHIE